MNIKAAFPELPDSLVKRLELLTVCKFQVGIGERAEVRPIATINDVLLAEQGLLTALRTSGLDGEIRRRVHSEIISPTIIQLFARLRSHANSEAEL